MRLLRLIWANCFRLLAQPATILFLIGAPIGILFFQNILMNSSGAGASGIIVKNLDRGVYAEQVLGRSQMDYDTEEDETALFNRLEDYTAELVYVFPADFSEKIEAGEMPVLQRYTRDENPLFDHYDTVLDQEIKQMVVGAALERANAMTTEEFLQAPSVTTKVTIAEYEVSFIYVFAMLMIVYFILLFSSSTGTDLMELREQRIMARMFVTPNHSFEIMVSLALSYFLLTFVSYAVVVTVARYLFDMKQFPLGLTLLIIGLMSLFSLSLSLFVAKITKNKSVLQLIPTLYGMLGFLSTLFALIERTDSGIIVKLAYLTPIYWLKEMMIHGDILKNTGIILLMSLLLLTAGSYNLRAFIEE